ncbi:MAG: hypothetical protein ACRDGU_01775 [Actinomycetota bacterium]
MTMRKVLFPSVLVLALVVSACAERSLGQKPRGADPGIGSSPPPPNEQRYEATAMVLQASDGPAMLCLGGIAESLPPQCGTMRITNWEWDQVQGEERLSGVTWGEYHVVGTYDGESFTILQVGPPRQFEDPLREPVEIPCPEPEGGWVATDPSRASEDDLDAAGSLATSQPDSAGWWMKVVSPPVGEDVYGPNDVVLNAAFTGDIGRHQEQLAEVWGGPLCVVRYERTESELLRIQDELTATGPEEFGIEVLFSGVDVVRNRVEVGVVVLDEETRTAIDDRYGEGTVRVSVALQPVD